MIAKMFEVADGDTISILAKVPVSVFDPAQQIKAVARSYRVVATTWGPVLKLVELQEEPVRMTSDQWEEGVVGALPAGTKVGCDPNLASLRSR